MYSLITEKTLDLVEVSTPIIIFFPKIVKKFTLLRAPFRHKLTKKNYTLTQYKSIFYFSLFFNYNIKIKDISELIRLIKLTLRYLYWFETSIQYIHKVDLYTHININKSKL